MGVALLTKSLILLFMCMAAAEIAAIAAAGEAGREAGRKG